MIFLSLNVKFTLNLDIKAENLHKTAYLAPKLYVFFVTLKVSHGALSLLPGLGAQKCDSDQTLDIIILNESDRKERLFSISA